MKKIFSIVAAALVAFSFTSCENEKTGSNFCKITISNIEATSADVEIVPADTTAYYGATFFYGDDFAKYGADTLAADYASQLATLAQQYGASALIQHGYILQGKLSSPVENLSPNTEFALIVYQLEVNGNEVALGKEISYKTFKTKDIEIASEVDLGILEGGGFEDYRSEDGSYIAYAADNATYDVTLNIYDEDFNGNYTEADLEAEYSYIWTAEMNSETALSIAKAELKNVPGNGDVATISGWVVASNNIKYKFSFTYPTVEEASAPKKAAAKNALKPATLKVVRK
jgi:hypothetical protein